MVLIKLNIQKKGGFMEKEMFGVLNKKRLRKSETAKPEKANRKSYDRQAKKQGKSAVQENSN